VLPYFLLGPQALMELVGPTGGKIKGSTGRSGALPICCGTPKRRRRRLELPEEKLQGKTRQGVSAADFFPASRTSSKAQRNDPFSSAALCGTGGKLQGKTGQGISAADFFPASRTSSKAQRNNPFSSTALFGPPRQETVVDRARGALRASARTDTSSDDGAHSEANRKAASKKAAKKPCKVGGKLGVGLFINESRF